MSCKILEDKEAWGGDGVIKRQASWGICGGGLFYFFSIFFYYVNTNSRISS